MHEFVATILVLPPLHTSLRLTTPHHGIHLFAWRTFPTIRIACKHLPTEGSPVRTSSLCYVKLIKHILTCCSVNAAFACPPPSDHLGCDLPYFILPGANRHLLLWPSEPHTYYSRRPEIGTLSSHDLFPQCLLLSHRGKSLLVSRSRFPGPSSKASDYPSAPGLLLLLTSQSQQNISSENYNHLFINTKPITEQALSSQPYKSRFLTREA
jgi:hypothetical protein